MIENYKFTKGFINLDCGQGDEKICNVYLDIVDDYYVNVAKEICNNDSQYYEDGWMVEMVVDEDATSVIGGHELFYIGDEGRVSVCFLSEENNGKLIKELDEFLLDQLTYKGKSIARNILWKYDKELGWAYFCPNCKLFLCGGHEDCECGQKINWDDADEYKGKVKWN